MQPIRKLHKDGTHRSIAPSATLEIASPHLAAMGITRIANVTGLDRLDIPVVNAYRPNSRSLSVSQGKGTSLDAAKASAVMEAVEGFHAEQIELPIKEGSYNDLAGELRLVRVDALAFLRETEFDPDRPLLWIEGIDLMSSANVWLPYELVHTDYTLPRLANAGCFVASTNGLASGNHSTEAIIHGICEVIERDAHTLWHLLSAAEKAATRLNLSTLPDAACQSLIRTLRDKGMKVGVWDMTSDTGIATFFCLILDEKYGGHSGAGAGTHLNAGIALSRAITEAAQVRTNYITGARDDLEPEEYERVGMARKSRYAEHLFAAETGRMMEFHAVPSSNFDTLDEDLFWLLKRLETVGIREVISVDLTKSEFEIPVVRIVIPGLEGPHDHDDYCAGQRARNIVAQAAG